MTPLARDRAGLDLKLERAMPRLCARPLYPPPTRHVGK